MPRNSIPYLEYQRKLYADLLKSAKEKREQRKEEERQLSPDKSLENRKEYLPPPAPIHGDLNRAALWSFMIFLFLSDVSSWGVLPGLSANASKSDVSDVYLQVLEGQIMESHQRYCETDNSAWDIRRRKLEEIYRQEFGKHYVPSIAFRDWCLVDIRKE